MAHFENLNQVSAWVAFTTLKRSGHFIEPRGKKTVEVVCFMDYINYPFHSFSFRNDNLDYIKREFQWYLKGDPKDQRICDHASIWKTIVQPSGLIFSNYGYYWFRRKWNGLTSFDYIIQTLREDPDTRQAYIPMLNHKHLFEGNKDVVCTKGITFRILNGTVIMIVDMRSSDLAIGASIDWPCFSWLHEMVCAEMGIPKGRFIFMADSLHIYEDQWDYMDKVIKAKPSDVEIIEYPQITSAYDLIDGRFESDFGQWLLTAKL